MAFSLRFMVMVGILSTDAKGISQPIGLPTDHDWTSLNEKVQFLPASDEGSPLLRHEQRRFLSYYSDHFVDGQETQYNEYAQAWRLLGLYVHCYTNAEGGRRHLEDGGEGGEDEAGANEEEEEQDGDEQAQEEEEEQEEVQEEENDDGSVCERHLLWAAVSPTLFDTLANYNLTLIATDIRPHCRSSDSMLTWTMKGMAYLNTWYLTHLRTLGTRLHAKLVRVRRDVSKWIATKVVPTSSH